MLSEQAKQEMLADASDPSRTESFRRLRALQESRRMSLQEYCAFCESMAELFPAAYQPRRIIKGGKFLL